MHRDLDAVPASLEKAPTRGMARWRLKRGSSHGWTPRMGAVALGGLLVLAVAGILIGFAVSGSTPKAATVSTTSSTATVSSAPTAAQVAGDKVVLRATDQVTSAGDAMSVGMNDMHSLPTVPIVAAVVDPYATALARYQSTLQGTAVEDRAAPWRRSVLSRIDQINSLIAQLPDIASARLGSWIDTFYLQTAELQSAIEALQSALGQHTAA